MRLARFCLHDDPTPLFAMADEHDCLHEIASFATADELLGPLYEPGDYKLLTPLPRTPGKILAIGMNYNDHIAEMKHLTVPEDPVVFLKVSSSLQNPNEPIEANEAWGQVDYEGELVVVIGRNCKNVSEAEALDYVMGYTLGNDVTARTLQRKDTQWGRAKNFDTFCPVGPYLLKNEGQDPHSFRIRTWLDDQLVQDGETSDMRFSVPFLISYLSHVMTLEPGDLLFTGTPKGVGSLKNGQRVKIVIDEIGALENPVIIHPATVPAGVHQA